MSIQKQGYVVGFLFDDNGDVAMIEKNKPKWQMGLLNGIGGKIERDELPLDAMVREFEEETGVSIGEWDYILRLYEPAYELYVYRLHWKGSIRDIGLRSTTEEQVTIINVRDLFSLSIIPSARWMVAMAFAGQMHYEIELPGPPPFEA